MRAAWDQIGDVLTVNRQIRRAQLATKAASALYVKSSRRCRPNARWRSPRRCSRKVLASSTTLATAVKVSRLPRAAVRRPCASRCGRTAGWRAMLLTSEARATGLTAIIGGINADARRLRRRVGRRAGATLEQVNDRPWANAWAERRGPLGPPRPRPRIFVPSAAHFFFGARAGRNLRHARAALSSHSRRRTDATLPPGIDLRRIDLPSWLATPSPPTICGTALGTFNEALSVRVEPLPRQAGAGFHASVHQKALEALEPHRRSPRDSRRSSGSAGWMS